MLENNSGAEILKPVAPTLSEKLEPQPATDDRFRRGIAWGILVTCMITTVVVLGGLLYYGPKVPEAILTLTAGLGGSILGQQWQKFGTVVDFLFGSSSGSKNKDNLVPPTGG